MDGVRLVTLFSYFSICIWIAGCANSSSQPVEVVFHGFARTKGSRDIHLFGGCQSGRFDLIASSKVQTDGNWEFKANISTACAIYYTKYYSTSWDWEYLDSRDYRPLRTELLKDGNAVVYTEFNNDKAVIKSHLDVYFELRIPECSSCFAGYTVCGYCHQGNLLTDRLSCGHRAVSSDDGKRYLVKRSLFKGCNFRWSWKNLSNSKKEFEILRHTFISGNCATSNEVWAIRNTQWGVVSKSNVGECFNRIQTTTAAPTTSDKPRNQRTTTNGSTISVETTQTTVLIPSTEPPNDVKVCTDRNITLALNETLSDVEVEIIPNHILALPVGVFKYVIRHPDKNCSQTISIQIKAAQLGCPKVLTGVVSPNTGRSGIVLNIGGVNHKIELPVGKYPYTISSAEQNCSLIVHILDYRLIRRLEFRADYPVLCKHINDKATKSLVMNTAEANYQQIEQICGNVCGRPAGVSPSLICTNDTLTIAWPTNIVYSGDVISIPEEVKGVLTSAIKAKGSILQIVVLNQHPPVIFPHSSAEDGSAYLHLSSSCIDNSQYNKQTTGECEPEHN